jgi:NADPH:quinone reductase-like Zn-dependent oxidoreductase/NAD(P)-dependent dehydrogenase (short-subunit alcohol dehydrogenase family)
MNIGNPGLLDSLEFIKDTSYYTPVGATDIEIEIKATGLNFRDCLTALGQIEFQTLGGEGAGVITRVGEDVPLDYKIGDRVVVCGPPTFRSYLRSSPENVVKIPDSLSYAEAASIPINFVTAYYCLRKIANLQPGERILIHLGAGGTGQAAIQIAQQVGAIVYTTVGSESKKRFLVETYGISEQHIFYSRDTTFADAIMRVTNGQGVDVVLNSLSGDALIASWDCVAKFGRFVEIGKKDVHDRSRLPMFNFDKNISFTSFDLIVLNQRPHIVTACLREIYAMLDEGLLHKVTPLTVHGIREVETAFRNLQSGNSIGKMAVEMRPNDIVKTRLAPNNVGALDADVSYMIAGGLGGLGRSIARWMVERGARNLILLSRKGAKTGDAIELIEELRNKGVRIEAPICDITSVESLLSVLDHCAKTMPPIRGCIQSTMVLRDSVFENMTFEDWNTCISPKVVGSWNLHSLLPTNLDLFLFLSSISGILGFPSQANYAAANTYVDALAHHRIANGQRASTLNLGWMANEGVIAGNDFLEKRFKNMGVAIPISSEEFHSLLDIHCGRVNAAFQTIVGIDTPLGMQAKGASVPLRMTDPLFCHLQDEAVDDGQTDSHIAHSVASQLRAAENLSDCAAIITRRLVEKVCNAICIPEAEVDVDMPLHEYGVDSLLAIELRNWAMKECAAEITVFELMDDSSFKHNGIKIARKSRFCSNLVESSEKEK